MFRDDPYDFRSDEQFDEYNRHSAEHHRMMAEMERDLDDGSLDDWIAAIESDFLYQEENGAI